VPQEDVGNWESKLVFKFWYLGRGDVSVYGSDRYEELFTRMDKFLWGDRIDSKKIDRLHRNKQHKQKHYFYVIFHSAQPISIEILPTILRKNPTQLATSQRKLNYDFSEKYKVDIYEKVKKMRLAVNEKVRNRNI